MDDIAMIKLIFAVLIGLFSLLLLIGVAVKLFGG